MADAELDAALAVLEPSPGGAPRSLLVGLSGGLDSTVLLHALAARRGDALRLRAIHVHHGLHPQADDWTAHCRVLCDALAVPLHVVRVRVPADSPLGPEGAAREARHRAFQEALEPGESLVLAHHLDDQAETVLLRLLRASGSGGVAGMRASRPFGGSVLLRPLLDLPRATLRGYAQAHGLHWCEDPSNASTDADRNFLRLRVLPLLGERWPRAARALARSATQLAEDARLLDEATAERVRALGGGPDWLPIAGLQALDPGWRARVLRAWTAARGLPPLPGAAPTIISAQVLSAPYDRAARYRWRDAELRRWRDRLYALRAHEAAATAPWSLEWNGLGVLQVPGGGRLCFDPPTDASLEADFGACRVGSRQGGERILRRGHAHSHALKECLQQADLPPWKRTRLPVLRDGGGEVLAAGDGLLSARLEAWCEAHGTRLQWQRPAGD